MDITVTNQQQRYDIEEDSLVAAAGLVLADSSLRRGSLDIAVVDDDHMQRLNRDYLQHDYPTDVLSFALTEEADYLEGQIVVSADTAAREAQEYGWDFCSELALYVVHGALHLIGYRDKSPGELAEMRAAELRILNRLGRDQIPRQPIQATPDETQNASMREVC